MQVANTRADLAVGQSENTQGSPTLVHRPRIVVRGTELASPVSVRGVSGLVPGTSPKEPEVRSQRGFTTVELMIVMAMMGLVLAASWGNFRSVLAHRRLSSAASSLATQMRLARERAVAEGNDYIVTFMTGTNSYEIWDDEGSDGSTGADDRKFVHDMPSRTTVQNPVFFGSNRVIFHADGTCNASGAVEITNGELIRTIAILASTGKVSIQ